MYDDYNCFICLFCVLPFQVLKTHTVDTYIGLYYCLLVIPTSLAMGLCLARLLEVFEVQSRRMDICVGICGGGMLPRFCMRLVKMATGYSGCDVPVSCWYSISVLMNLKR